MFHVKHRSSRHPLALFHVKHTPTSEYATSRHRRPNQSVPRETENGLLRNAMLEIDAPKSVFTATESSMDRNPASSALSAA